MTKKRKHYLKTCARPVFSELEDLKRPVWRIYLDGKIADGYTSEMIAVELDMKLEDVNNMF